MKQRTNILALLVAVLVVSPLFLGPALLTNPAAHAVGNPVLRVSGSTGTKQYGSNITDTSLTSGTTFTMTVNVTNAGLISAFDVTVGYGISALGTPVLSPVKSSLTLSGGIFDPARSDLPTGCSILVIRQLVLTEPIYTVRVVASIQSSSGGTCGLGIDGNGNLFSITFNVIGTGTDFLDIQQASGSRLADLVVGGPGIDFARVPNLQVKDGYFNNKPGLSPVASFTYTPSAPVIKDSVLFDGSQSRDPAHPTAPNNGITKYLWFWGDNAPSPVSGGNPGQHVFIVSSTTPGAGYFEVRLIVNATAGVLAENQQVVYVSPGIVHGLEVQISLQKSTVKTGDPVQLTVTVYNVGNQNETAKLAVTYDYPSTASPTTAGSESSIPLPLTSKIRPFNYTIQTTNLPPRIYTITAQVLNLDPTVQDVNPQNNMATQTFTVTGTAPTNNLNVLQVVGISAVALAAVGGCVYVIRRRRSQAETASEQLA
jgi:hypothetical protein